MPLLQRKDVVQTPGFLSLNPFKCFTLPWVVFVAIDTAETYK
jgi:hypothetical protein